MFGYDHGEEALIERDERSSKRMSFILKALAVLLFAAAGILCGWNCAHAETGFATYYTEASCQAEGTSGVWTASGERYVEDAYTCALPHRGFGRFYMVYSPTTGRSVVVRHTDFGPGKKPRKRGVIIDLTPKAFREVCGDLKLGKCEVSYQEVRS